MNQTYLNIARQGKNNWWRYLLGTIIILSLGLIVGTISAYIAFYFFSYYIIASNFLKEFQSIQDLLASPYFLNYIFAHFPYIFYLLGIFTALRWLHQREFMSLFGADKNIRWLRCLQGFAIWLAMQSTLIFIGYLIEPESFEFAFKPTEWFLLLSFVLIMTPLQTSTEELFFRGYILQGLGLITKHPLILMIINGVLFMLPHLGNPEIQRGFFWMALYYFSFGVFCCLLTLKDNRLELALGVHAAINLSHIIVTTKDSALQLPAIWILKEVGEPQWLLLWFLIECGLFYLVVFGLRRQGLGIRE